MERSQNNLKLNIMTTQEIYKLASEITENQVDNIVAGWEQRNETEAIKTFKSLVRLGDSKQLACVTAISEKYKEVSEIYAIAYQK